MRNAVDDTSLRQSNAHVEMSGRLTMAVAALVSILWIVLLVRGPIDWDLGWQMFAGRRIHEGARLYVDVGTTEQHPPLYIWLCAALSRISIILHVDPVRFFLAAITTACGASAWYATRFVKSAKTPSSAVFAIFAFTALALFGFAAASAEQIAVAFILPYLAAASNPESHTFNRRTRILVGLLAGLGMAMKPHYALVWLAIEGALALRTRNSRSFLRTESIATFGVWIAYIAGTAVFTPQYFHAARRAAGYYSDFMPGSLRAVLWNPATIYVACAVITVFFARRRARVSADVTSADDVLNAGDVVTVRAGSGDVAYMMLLAALAMWIGAIVQRKGWPHHMLPAIAFSIAAMAIAVTSVRPRRALAITILLLLFGTYRIHTDRELLRRAQVGAPTFLWGMSDVVHRFAPHGPILMLSYSLSPAFPLVNETGASWTLPESSLWMVSGLYRDAWQTRGPYAYRAPNDWVPFEKEVHELIWRGVRERPPAIVIIEANMDSRFDMKAFAETDPRMKAFFSNFIKVGSVGPYDILLPIAPRVAERLNGPGSAATFVASGW
jgi:hypothetical protein